MQQHNKRHYRSAKGLNFENFHEITTIAIEAKEQLN